MNNNHTRGELISLQVSQSRSLDKGNGQSNQGNNRRVQEDSGSLSDSNHSQKSIQAENHPRNVEGYLVSEIKNFPYNQDNFGSPADSSHPAGLSKAFLDALGRHNKIHSKLTTGSR